MPGAVYTSVWPSGYKNIPPSKEKACKPLQCTTVPCRRDYGNERYEKAAFQEAVAKEFEALQDASFHVIDADQSIEEVHADVQAVVDATILRQREQALPLADLWADGQ